MAKSGANKCECEQKKLAKKAFLMVQLMSVLVENGKEEKNFMSEHRTENIRLVKFFLDHSI